MRGIPTVTPELIRALAAWHVSATALDRIPDAPFHTPKQRSLPQPPDQPLGEINRSSARRHGTTRTLLESLRPAKQSLVASDPDAHGDSPAGARQPAAR